MISLNAVFSKWSSLFHFTEMTLKRHMIGTEINIQINGYIMFPHIPLWPYYISSLLSLLFSLIFSFFPSLLLMVSLFWLLRVAITGLPFSLCFAHACLTTLFLAYLHQLSDLQKQKSSMPPPPHTYKSIMYIFLPGFKSSSCVFHKDKNPYKRMTTVFFFFHVSN